MASQKFGGTNCALFHLADNSALGVFYFQIIGYNSNGRPQYRVHRFSKGANGSIARSPVVPATIMRRINAQWLAGPVSDIEALKQEVAASPISLGLGRIPHKEPIRRQQTLLSRTSHHFQNPHGKHGSIHVPRSKRLNEENGADIFKKQGLATRKRAHYPALYPALNAAEMKIACEILESKFGF